MPATRIHSPSTSTPRERYDRNHRTLLKAPNEAEIIILSSDDESSIAAIGHSNSSRSGPHKKKKAALLPVPLDLGEVLDITDSDDAQSSSRSTAWRAEENTVESLKHTVASLEQALKVADRRRADEVAELKSLEKTQTEEIAVLRCALRTNDFSELEEHILCEVCTHRMWKPYLLPDCGHCFCQDCLVDWFSTTQARFMASHPDYDARRVITDNQLRGLLSGIPVLLNPQVKHQIQALLTNLQKFQPEYTCPSCRKSVLTKPVEDFRLKSLVRHIAGLQGESSPRKKRAHGHGGTNVGPFDGFFSTPTTEGRGGAGFFSGA